MHTEAINHDPAVTFFQTGFQLAGRPSIGSWISYGLGSENQDLPAFVVMVSQGGGNSQALADRLWGSGFLPTKYQGVKFRSGADPVLYLVESRRAIDRDARRRFLDDLAQLNRLEAAGVSGPGDRHAHRAVRDGVSDADVGAGADGSFEGAASTLRDVRAGFAQAGHLRGQLPAGAAAGRAWRAVHPAVPSRLGSAQQSAEANRGQCHETDQPSAALIQDLKQRGHARRHAGRLGRRVRPHGLLAGTLTETNYGRDHHPRCFTIWMAGGGIKRGITYGETDDFSYNIVSDPVDVHDLHATILHCLGVDHTRLTYKFQGRHYRLTDVQGRVV